MSHSLKFIITFRKSIYDPVYVENYAAIFFDYARNNLEKASAFIITNSKPKSIDIDDIGTPNLYEMEVTLDSGAEQDYGNIFFEITQMWCDPEINILSNLWLRLANPYILKNTAKPYHSDVDINEIAFGTFPDMKNFVQYYHYSTLLSHKKEMMCTFMHSQRKLMIFTCFTHSLACNEVSHNKFQFDYQSISRVIISYVPSTDFVQIYFHLQHTPFVFLERREDSKEDSNLKKIKKSESILSSYQEYLEKTWDRTLDFGCSCKKFHCPVEKIGKCSVFKLVISKKQQSNVVIERLIQRCSSTTLFHFTNIKTVIRKYEKFINDFKYFPFNESTLNLITDENFQNDIKFKCQFAWEVLNSKSSEVKDQILLKYETDAKSNHWVNLQEKIRSFFVINKKFAKKKLYERIKKIADALSSALFDISEMINKHLIFVFEDVLTILFEYHLNSEVDDEIPEGMCLVRRIILTPSKIIYLPPTEHFDNRVIRKFQAEHLLRISIQDDDFNKLTFAVQHNSGRAEFLKRCVSDILLRGIVIDSRKYDILAASNSQLREHGFWMYARDNDGYTAELIREWMGDFSDIKSVAKYMARMGQCFSSSDESAQIQLEENEVSELEDIIRKSGNCKYIFSDGVGMISKDLAKEVRLSLAKKNNLGDLKGTVDLYDPSAFQIRFKGCKGMLVESRTLKGRKIGIRPSMKKFTCSSSSVLEIVKISAPRAVFLNQPLITILENLGVEPGAFLELQKKMVFNLTDSLIYEKKALKMLENSTSLDFPFRKLNESGISLTQEPFFHSLLFSVYKSKIGNLKRKARIAIPPKYGRNMLGVIDETRTLEYGQIFVQYSEKIGTILSKAKPLKGTVVVTKNPCMHPGDVRKFEAIDVPALHHIKDCIVFPAKGKRPHPDEMAGSDLDGDEYVLIWHPDLIFPEDNYNAMDYPENKENSLNRPITVKDMIDFLCTYIQNDNIGQMANAHLAWADFNDEGIFSEVCKKIAKKYPQALDFAKSGTTQYLKSSERPQFYPDFMEKGSQKDSYKSKKTLGLLYRMIRNLEASVSSTNNKVDVVPNSKFEYPGWKVFEELAKQRRDQYIKRVKNILKKYGLQNEAQALTGYISEFSDCNKNRYDSDNIVLLSKRYFSDTLKRYQLKFIKDCENQSLNLKEKLPEKEIKLCMASAWYMVTYQDAGATILSFPWVVSDILCDIKNRKKEKGENISESMLIDNFDTFLLSHIKFQLEIDGSKCNCVSFLNEIMLNWVKKSSFTLMMSSEGIFCFTCVNRIVSNFIKISGMYCCSYKNRCHCSRFCSPMKMILECFKYYASEIIPDIGKCQNIIANGTVCKGFQSSNLHSSALKTYAVIAITKGMHLLEIINNSIPDIEPDVNEEGDPIRIQVVEEFRNILIGNVENVCRILEDLTGVKRVTIDGFVIRSHFCILIQSIGKPLNRWNLEELLMNPECPDKIKSRLDNGNKYVKKL